MDLSKYGNPLNKLFSYYYFTKFNLDNTGLLFQKEGYIIYVKENINNNLVLSSKVV